VRTWAPKRQTPIIQFYFNWTHVGVIAGVAHTNCFTGTSQQINTNFGCQR
jgi:hypothetical protein